MKKSVLALATCLLALASCNKDEEIIIDGPDDGGNGGGRFTVVEYLPAPGQFINEKGSGFNDVATATDAVAMAQRRLDRNDFVSLGAWGGYIVVRTPVSIAAGGGYDFAIAGNAFDSSNEPGIVWVMADSNGNGIPDDIWYELKGSWFGKEGYERDYWVTYFRPSGPGEDVRWTDCHGAEGTVRWNGTYHSQDFYYPLWIEADSYTLRGSRLPAMTEQDPATGQWRNLPFKWGYADNEGDDSALVEIDGKTVQKNYFRIADAVDAEGNSVFVEKIDFIKVQTAINGSSGVLGENSTEVCGFFLK